MVVVAPVPPLPEAWITALRARAERPPARPRERLYSAAGGAAAGMGAADLAVGSSAAIGTIERELALRIAAAGLPLRRRGADWCIGGPVDAGLERIARWLHERGLCSRWRDELLDVVDDSGAAVGRVERAAARALGLTTRAVHLVGCTTGGAVWVQQRAFDKATDPGRWDTLMGGTVAAGESIAATLARETAEEAGLALADLHEVQAVGRLTLRGPVDDGYRVEHIDVFDAVVPHGLVPENRDGEVEGFECLTPTALLERLQADAFTLEATLILVGWLQRRGAPAAPLHAADRRGRAP